MFHSYQVQRFDSNMISKLTVVSKIYIKPAFSRAKNLSFLSCSLACSHHGHVVTSSPGSGRHHTTPPS